MYSSRNLESYIMGNSLRIFMKKVTRIGTYIPKEAYNILKELVEEYGSQAKVLEVALKLLNEIHRRGINPIDVILREGLIENFDCVVMARTNIENFIRGDIEKFYQEEFIYAMVKFILRKDVETCSIEDIVRTLNRIYVKGARWFSSITLDEKEGTLEITFTHTSDLAYSNFFARYFEEFLKRINYKVISKRVSSKFFSIILEAR